MQAEGVRDGHIAFASFDSVPLDPSRLTNLSDDAIPMLSVRDTPAPYAPPETRRFLDQDDDALRQETIDMLAQIQDAYTEGRALTPEQRSILPVLWRNTFTVGQIAALLERSGFDPYAEQAGGQEDTAMALGLAFSGKTIVTKTTPVGRYEDLRFKDAAAQFASGVAGEGHTEKFEREQKATDKMWQRLRETHGVIPPKERVFLGTEKSKP